MRNIAASLMEGRGFVGTAASGDLKYLPSLDGYRGLAMLMVIGYHMLSSPGFGWIAMQMFFVLSGFLISRMLIVEEHLPMGQCLKLFYWRRILRIFPALYAYLLVMLVVSWISSDFASARLMIPWAATYLHNLAWIAHADDGITRAGVFATQHLWSLSVEEHFYVLWPILFLLAGPRYRLPLIFSLILLAPCLRWLIQEYWVTPAGSDRDYSKVIYVFSGSHLDAFAIGSLITLILHRQSARQSSLRTFLVLCAAAAALGIWTSGFHWPSDFTDLRQFAFGYPLYMPAEGQPVWGYTVVNLLCAQALILAVHHPLLVRWLSNRFLRWCGKISYIAYLFHQPILYYFKNLRPLVESYLGSPQLSIALLLIVYLLVVFAVGSLGHRYFESYFIRIKPRHRAQEAATAAHAPGPAMGTVRHTDPAQLPRAEY